MTSTAAENSGTDEFAQLIREIHGIEPEPWHLRLRQEVADGGWPDRCRVPAHWDRSIFIDIAVDAFSTNPDRWGRRLVLAHRSTPLIDELQRHAEVLAEKLRHPDGPATASMAARLRLATGCEDSDPPLRVAGIPDSPAIDLTWTARCRDAVVLIGSVEQVGSALLFRSISGSPRSAPVHAGLIGVDSLLMLLDLEAEAPFHRTLADLRDVPSQLFTGLSSVRIDASPAAIDGLREFHPNEHDTPNLRPSGRPSSLQCRTIELDIGTTSEAALHARAHAIAETVGRLLDGKPARIGVFLSPNCDHLGRIAFVQALSPLGRVVDTIDPRTPLSRAELGQMLKSIAESAQVDDTTITIADDSLVSTPLPLFDAVVFEVDAPERMLHRLATTRAPSGSEPCAVVLRFETRRGRGRPPKPTPALKRQLQLWSRLERVSAAPVSATGSNPREGSELQWQIWSALDEIGSQELKSTVPRLLPSHLELLERTSPTPAADPHASRFVVSTPEDSVRWCWRRDLPSSDASPQRIEDYLTLLPPTGAECQHLSRSMLLQTGVGHASRVGTSDCWPACDGRLPREWFQRGSLVHFSPWRRICGLLHAPGDLRAGDVVLALAPGVGRNVNPDKRDVAASAWLHDLGVVRVRSLPPDDVEVPVGFYCGGFVPAGPRSPAVQAWIASLLDHSQDLAEGSRTDELVRACETLRLGRVPLRVHPHPTIGWVIEASIDRSVSALVSLPDHRRSSCFDLAAHCRETSARVVMDAKSIGLPSAIVTELELAAKHLDFDEDEGLLRRSAIPRGDDQVHEGECTLPRTEAERLLEDPTTLVRHLIATRRGCCRPLPSLDRMVRGPQAVRTSDATSEAGPPPGPGRLRMLSTQFGPWPLAMLESMLRISEAAAVAESSFRPAEGNVP